MSLPRVENEDKYIQVLEWEEDVLEDRLKNIRMEGRDKLAQAYHRRLEKVRTKLRERS